MRYPLIFTSGNVEATGLTPTFTVWRYQDGTAVPGIAPTISKVDDVHNPGLYDFEATPAKPIYFVVDGGASLPIGERYIRDIITPDDYASAVNRRFFDVTTDANGNLTSVNIYHYASKNDADVNINPLFVIHVAAAYDDDGNLTAYKETRN